MQSVNTLFPVPRSLFAPPETLTGKVIAAFAASMLVAVCAHISLPLGFTPVPLTLSDLAVLVTGFVLGPVPAFSALMLYLFEGALGLPVFTPGGLGGTAQLLGPTGGFLFSYPLVAALAAFGVRRFGRWMPNFLAGLLSGLFANVLLFTFGAVWFATFLHISATTAFHLAVQPFLLVNAIKVVLAAGSTHINRRLCRQA